MQIDTEISAILEQSLSSHTLNLNAPEIQHSFNYAPACSLQNSDICDRQSQSVSFVYLLTKYFQNKQYWSEAIHRK